VQYVDILQNCADFEARRSSMALRSVRYGVRSRKLSNIGQSLDG
jgi:hypothetical protein